MIILNHLHAHWILDSRGLPTVSCTVYLEENGRTIVGNASVPSGASTGSHEAIELRDNEAEFHGKGVNKAVRNIETVISESLTDKEFTSALEVDQVLLSLDATSNKSLLGANAILAVSMATHRAFARLHNVELWQYLQTIYFPQYTGQINMPRLMCNLLNGGAHADSGLDIQEFMVIPDTGTIETDVRCASEIYHTLKKNLTRDHFTTAIGDEVGFAPKLDSTKTAFAYLDKAIEVAGYDREKVDLGADCAASEYFKDGVYKIDGEQFNARELSQYYAQLQQEFNFLSIEDPFQEDDLAGWKHFTDLLGEKIQIIGDDLFVTNPTRFQKLGIEEKNANAILIKLNQVGSVSETCEVINNAQKNGFATAVSHRSGETTDSFISDLAVACHSEFIKLGAPARGERVAKYNRLLQINEKEPLI
jgi:enolase